MLPKEKRTFTTHPAPDLIPPEHRPSLAEIKGPGRRSRRKLVSFFLLFLIIILSSCTMLVARSNSNFFVGVKNGFLIRQLSHIFTGARSELKGEEEDRINFLLLGIGGPGHDGPYLSDTIILASFKPSSHEAAMLSIPRDLVVPTGNGAYLKVNHVYALNQKSGLNHAFVETKRIIGDTFDAEIHYMGVLDFQGFVELIDSIGGVKVTVDRSFTDLQFPAGPNKYQPVSFSAGEQKMNGVTALQFARSRHGNNGEGSDFARSARQQKIILATKEKLSSFNTIFNPKKITSLFSIVNEYTKTDMEPWEMVRLAQLTKNISSGSIASFVLDDSPNGLLYSGISSLDGAYILQPKGGSYTQLKQLVQNMLSNNGLREEKPRILLQNGTAIENLAGTIENELINAGIAPVAIGNASQQDTASTVLYDYTDGKKPKTKNFLESRFGVTAQTNIPLDLLSYNLVRSQNITAASGEFENLDFLLILGEDVTKREALELIRTLTPEELRASSTPTTTDALLDKAAQNGAPGQLIE